MPGRRRQNAPKQSTRKTTKAVPTDSPGRSLFSFTVDTATGAVVSVEALDAAGARRKVPIRQQKTLAREGRERLESVIEDAFEAGINCVLGDSDEPPESAESELDPKLRHDLIEPLLQGSAAGRRLKREVLERAMLGTLIQNSINTAGFASRNA